MYTTSSTHTPRPEECQGGPRIVFLFALRKENEMNFLWTCSFTPVNKQLIGTRSHYDHNVTSIGFHEVRMKDMQHIIFVGISQIIINLKNGKCPGLIQGAWNHFLEHIP